MSGARKCDACGAYGEYCSHACLPTLAFEKAEAFAEALA